MSKFQEALKNEIQCLVEEIEEATKELERIESNDAFTGSQLRIKIKLRIAHIDVLKKLQEKKCSEGHDVDLKKAEYLGVQEGRKTSCDLYNCPTCGTTVAVKIIKEK